MGKQLRLDKILSDSGRWSRKEARDLVRQGRVRVDGVAAAKPDLKADPGQSEITVDGEQISWTQHIYLLLHKPSGYLTATEDRDAPTVLELIPAELRRDGLSPVGRLDKDTTGLLLLTDDGALNHALCSPKRHVDKVYLAWVEGTGTAADCDAFASGIQLGDGTQCLPAVLELLEPGLCRVTVREGKYHQVKRMLASRGLPVRQLKRISMGPVVLEDSLEAGQCRPLTAQELEKLRSAAGI
jgi:16S rRNA pseudouridine516 synthase